MIRVIDASVALKWFVQEDGSERASALLESADILIAPDLIIAEVCNASWKAVRSGTMLAEQQDHAAARLALAFDELAPLAPLAPCASALARRRDHPVYDCFYLALAIVRRCPLVTADRKLVKRAATLRETVEIVDLYTSAEP